MPEFKTESGPQIFSLFKERLLRLLSFDFKLSQASTEKDSANREEIFTHEFIRYLRPPYNIEMALEIAKYLNGGNWYLSKEYVPLATQYANELKREKMTRMNSNLIEGETSAVPPRRHNLMQQASNNVCGGLNSYPPEDLSFLENLSNEIDLRCLDDFVSDIQSFS